MRQPLLSATTCLLVMGSWLPATALAEACIIKAESDRMEIRLCQQNRSIPPNLFRTGFCKPQLAGQKTTVTFAAQCPLAPLASVAMLTLAACPISRTSTITG